MRSTVSNMFFVLGESTAKLPFLTLVFIGVSLIDLVGLGLVGPYLALVLGDEQDTLFLSVSSYFTLFGEFNRQELLSIAGFFLLLIYFFKTIFAAVLARVVIRFGQDQQVRLKTLLISKYLSLPYQEYVKNNHSHYTNIINVLTAQFANLIMIILQVWGDLIVAFAIIGLLIWTNTTVFFLLTSLLLVWLVGFDLLTRRALELHGRENVEASRDIFQHTDQALKGFKEIKIFALQSLFVRKLNASANHFALAQIGVNFISMLPKYLLELVIVGFLVCYCMGVVWNDEAKDVMLPTLGVFGVAAVRLLPIVRNFSASLNRIRSNRLCLEILAGDLRGVGKLRNHLESDSTPQKAMDASENGNWSLQLKNYCFHYPDEKNLVLNAVNLSIQSGEKIGIVGRSGSGKSTLVHGILGLLAPTKGDILLDGTYLSDAYKHWWQKISYVPQDTFVIDDSIKANITLGCDVSDIDADQLRGAIEAAGLIDTIKEMPRGVDTPIGGGGIRLSGGQKQRLALARALYANRSVLILDEAMSALDQETERLILHRILSQSSLTLLIISHREKTLDRCTRILQVSNGRVVEQNSQ